MTDSIFTWEDFVSYTRKLYFGSGDCTCRLRNLQRSLYFRKRDSVSEAFKQTPLGTFCDRAGKNLGLNFLGLLGF